MKLRNLLLVLAILFGGAGANAQMVGTDCFLQGHWVEVGINQMGGFGTCTSPMTYHTHSCCYPTVLTFTPGAAMDMSYDWGHDGWGTGSPALMGPYSQPGYPQEGWSLQVGATEYRNGAWGGLCTGEYDVPGTMTGYSNAGGVIKGTWTGGVAGLSLRQETRIDTEGSWIVITTIIRNTTAAPIADIYYERTLDPDNVSFWGAGPVTRNRIVHQNEDARHRVMVSANGESAGSTTVPAYDSVNSYLALATKDCRAKCGYLASGLTPTTTPAFLWALPTTAPDIGALGSNNLADVGIWVTFNIGTIAANDSAAVSYAYIFDRKTSIDSAFPDPRIVINGVEKLSEFPPTPDYDTFSACTTPGLTVLPVSIKYGDERCWTWGKWTWAPSTGLASTTGVTNNITIAALSGPTTFTITGTDSSVGMYSCNTKVFYLTVFPCYSASSNSPDSAAICEGDTLHLYCQGDSLGATYEWYGPGLIGATIGATQNTFKHPSTMADTGWYYVIKTIGTVSDTASTHVMIKKRPYVTATYNPPVCSGNPLLLYSNPDYAGETWSWTGPLGYTSTASDPTIPGSITGMSGDYKVITNLNGCIDSATVTVAVDTTPAVPMVSSNSPVCADSTLFLTSSTATPGVTYSWTGPSGFTSTLQNPSIPSVTATTAGTYSVTVRIGTCTSTASTIVSINVTPTPILGSNSPVCSGGSLNLTATGLPGSTFAWSGPLGFTSTLQYPSISPAITSNSGTYSVVVTLAGCPSQLVTINTVVDSTPEVPVVSTNSPGPPGATICQEDTLMLFANSGTAGVSYSWTGPNSFTSFAQNPIIYGATPLASGVYTVVVGLGSCTVQATIAATVTPTPPITLSSNSPICSGDADSVKLFATSNPGATFTWTGPYTFFSSAQNPVRTPVSTEHGGTYIATVLWEGCTNQTSIKIVVNQTPTPPWVKWLTYCQYYDAPYLQAVGSNLLWYTSAAGGAGSAAPPKPATDVVGIRFYWVNQTVSNCPSALDSIRVVVNPTPTVTVTADTTVCPWDSVMLSAVNPDVIAYYKWYPSMYLDNTTKANVTVRPETNMEYFVVSTNMYGCTDTASVRINVKENAVLHLPDSVQLFPGESYQIEPSTNCTKFSWTPSGGLSGKFIANPLASPEVSTKYVLTGETEWGCISRDSIRINIADESVISIPNAFAPGSVNNLFKPHLRGQAVLKYFRIFDRWGVMVYESTQMGSAGWDGTYKGVPQPVGVYVYEVSAVTGTGKVVNKAGNVTLLR